LKQFELLLENSTTQVRAAKDLDPNQIERCCQALSGFKSHDYRTFYLDFLNNSLTRLWNSGVDPLAPVIERSYPEAFNRPLKEKEHNQPDLLWKFAMSREFVKAIQTIDRNLQGRILVALAKISQAPTTLMGDTVKPLDRDLKGVWRYRVAGYRLLYRPVPETKLVLLLDFASRDAVYD
jgi:mRNA-degrading endonuclease RelE of RelBE toxin-antitoxin system